MIKRKKYFYLSILESFTYSIFCYEFNYFHIDFNIKVLSLYSNPGYYYLTCAIFSNLKNLKAGLYLIFIPCLNLMTEFKYGWIIYVVFSWDISINLFIILIIFGSKSPNWFRFPFPANRHWKITKLNLKLKKKITDVKLSRMEW